MNTTNTTLQPIAIPMKTRMLLARIIFAIAWEFCDSAGCSEKNAFLICAEHKNAHGTVDLLVKWPHRYTLMTELLSMKLVSMTVWGLWQRLLYPFWERLLYYFHHPEYQLRPLFSVAFFFWLFFSSSEAGFCCFPSEAVYVYGKYQSRKRCFRTRTTADDYEAVLECLHKCCFDKRLPPMTNTQSHFISFDFNVLPPLRRLSARSSPN